MTPDFTFTTTGSRWLLQPITEAARAWLQEHAIEGRYEGADIDNLCYDIVDAGFHIANSASGAN